MTAIRNPAASQVYQKDPPRSQGGVWQPGAVADRGD